MKRLDSKPPPWGAKKTWHNHYQRVDFLRKKGGPYAVRLVLTLENADKLRKDLNHCVKLAQRHDRDSIEIDAHFGNQTRDGFRLRTRVYHPDE